MKIEQLNKKLLAKREEQNNFSYVDGLDMKEQKGYKAIQEEIKELENQIDDEQLKIIKSMTVSQAGKKYLY